MEVSCSGERQLNKKGGWVDKIFHYASFWFLTLGYFGPVLENDLHPAKVNKDVTFFSSLQSENAI